MNLTKSLIYPFAVVIAGHVQAQTLDVSGIALGTPISDARKMVSGINSAYKVEDLRSSGKVAGFKATALPPGTVTPNDQLVVMSTDSGAVWFVGRQQNYAKGNRVAFTELEGALVQKYGQPTSVGRIGVSSKRWEIDKNGRVHRDKHSPGPCTSGFAAYDWSTVPGTQIGVLKNFAPGCGALVVSEARVENNDMMVTQLITKVIDSKRMYDELNGKERTSKQEKDNQLLQEKNSGIKLKL